MKLRSAPPNLTKENVYAAAEAIRLEMRTFRTQWFVEDAADPVDDCRDLTPYNCLACAALKAAGLPLPEGF